MPERARDKDAHAVVLLSVSGLLWMSSNLQLLMLTSNPDVDLDHKPGSVLNLQTTSGPSNASLSS